MPAPSTDTIYRITLLRHGESVGNADGYHQGQSEFDLTKKGQKQAQALANRWLNEGKTFNQAIASPLSRARHTAEIITQKIKMPLQFNSLWMEVNIGQLSGLKSDDAKEKFPPPDFTHPYLPLGGTGESKWELYLRGGQAVQDLLGNPPGDYLIVSHGGILNMVLYAILGIIPQANFHGPRFHFENTAFASLTYEPDQHKWRVLGLNDLLHWLE